MAIVLARQPVRQGRDPGRADLPRHRAARDPRPQRLDGAARRLRRRAPDRRPGQRAADRQPEEHVLRLRQGAGRRRDRGLRAGAWPGTSSTTSPRCAAPASRSTSTGGNGSPSPVPSTRTRSCGLATRYVRLRLRPAPRAPLKQSWVISGIKDLVVLKSTGSQFAGFLNDGYTTLPEATDRILATSLTARWRYAADGRGVGRGVRAGAADPARAVRRACTAGRCSRRCGRWGRPCSRPGTTSPRSGCRRRTSITSWSTCRRSGWRIPGEVFLAADRPYGLIQCAVEREGAADAGPAWELPAAFA